MTMNVVSRIAPPPEEPRDDDASDPYAPEARAARLAAAEALLMDYAAARDTDAIPLLSPVEQRRQALLGLRHISSLGGAGRYLSICRKVTYDGSGKPTFPGNAHTNVDDAINDAFFCAQKGIDVYWGMGAQENAGEHKPGRPYPKAIRQGPNTVASRCLYIDIDVKDGAHGSTREAADTLIAFARTTGFAPTMIVGSGTGGLHVYWRLRELVTPAQFKPRAEALVQAAQKHGLKFDAQCTSNICCLLRVAGTWNFKRGGGADARPVTLIYLNEDGGA
jgi:hypothetical protein